jgi:L-ascorbate metabolism protein UlaG (beta-lactamase superfamily)
VTRSARIALACAGTLAVVAGALVVDGWRAFGAAPAGQRLQRAQRSPNWRDGAFVNPQPLVNHVVPSLLGLLSISPHVAPLEPLAPVGVDPRRFDAPPSTGLRVTWLGHATTLVEIAGARVLTDPVWSERVGPFAWAGPRRWYPPPLALADLPPVDAVVISHDHYDHLDMDTVVALKDRVPRFFVPLGVGAHLEAWGVAPEKLVELDWWEHAPAGTVDITCTPARHASGRTPWDKDRTLWAGWAIAGDAHRVYFSGDTGMFPAMRDIGARLGPFDVTMIETGQYHAGWPDWHIGPERAVEAHHAVRGRVMLPVHWALLALAYHGWTEPVERVLAAAARDGTRVVVPRPGEGVEPGAGVDPARWWPSLTWETADQAPLAATGIGGAAERDGAPSP